MVPKLYPPTKNYTPLTSSGDNLKFTYCDETKLRALNSQPVRVQENRKLSHSGPSQRQPSVIIVIESDDWRQPLCNLRCFLYKALFAVVPDKKIKLPKGKALA